MDCQASVASWEGSATDLKSNQIDLDRVFQHQDQQDDPQSSDWIWATTLSPHQVSAERAVHLGHQRWDIENYGFNELINQWHADHVFKHDPAAIECFLLVAFLAYNLFHAFLARNVKPAACQGKTQIFWAQLIAAELYGDLTPASMPP